MTPGVLVAGIGNIFFGDDGFGPEVVRRLIAPRLDPLPASGPAWSTTASAACTWRTTCCPAYEALVLIDAWPGHRRSRRGRRCWRSERRTWPDWRVTSTPHGDGTPWRCWPRCRRSVASSRRRTWSAAAPTDTDEGIGLSRRWPPRCPRRRGRSGRCWLPGLDRPVRVPRRPNQSGADHVSRHPGQVVEMRRRLRRAAGAGRRLGRSTEDQHRDAGAGRADVAPGDWVLIHMGFAVEKVDAAGAERAMQGLELMGRGRDADE